MIDPTLAKTTSAASGKPTENTQSQDIISFLLEAGVLTFGDFTLKSGRKSPYFFNLGNMFQGQLISQLAHGYADVIQQHFPTADTLFGPAYKGIPLATAVAMSLSQNYNRNLGIAFDRKEIKDHGEGGQFVGSALTGNILLIDDVVTAGSAIRASIEKLHKNSAANFQIVGLVVALDRQEAVDAYGGQSALGALAQEFNFKTQSMVSFNDILKYVEHSAEYQAYLPAMRTYRQRYGA